MPRLEKRKIPVGILDINLYRDDLSTVDLKPVLNATDIPFSVQGKEIILMDDVLYTGRTIRAALDALFDHGRPARVQLLVLIDRGHRELPIEARYIGRTVQTSDDEIIEVKFQEIDDMEKVLLVRTHRSCPKPHDSSRTAAKPAGLLDIESLDRAEIEAILERARISSSPSKAVLSAVSTRCAAR